MKIKQAYPNFQDFKLGVHSKACISKICTLPYSNFGIKCFVLNFLSEKDMQEKS